MIKEMLKKTFLFIFWKEYREIRDYWRWLKNGRPVPPPHGIKQGVIKEYARIHQCPVFFETGTYRGDMIQAVKQDFERIYSVELSEALYQKARLRFQNDSNITILRGDSGIVLAETLKQISKPCIFWLDAHYSGANTAKGEKLSPIVEEIIPILNHCVKNHIILIDDAREFRGRDGYPGIVEFTQEITQIRPDLMVTIELDVIRILKK